MACSARETGCQAIDRAIQSGEILGVRSGVGRSLERFGFQGGTPLRKSLGTNLVNAADAHMGPAQNPAGILSRLIDLVSCFQLRAFESGLGVAFRREHLVDGVDFGAHSSHLARPARRSES